MTPLDFHQVISALSDSVASADKREARVLGTIKKREKGMMGAVLLNSNTQKSDCERLGRDSSKRKAK